MEIKAKYKVGDVVRLKSGGPSMTVDSISDYYGRICCHWFARDKLHSGEFSPETIELENELDPLKKLV